MYLSIKQHDQFRTLLMGFEIPFRGYIADVLMTHYSSANDLETALLAKNASLTPADPFFLRDVLPNSVKHSKIEKMYNTFSTASLTTEIVAVDQDIFIIGKAVLGTQLSHFPRKTRNKPDFILTVMCFCASQMFFKALHDRYSFNAFIVSASFLRFS